MQLYFDANVYYRFFDDVLLENVTFEKNTILAIFKLILKHDYKLFWSYALDKEFNNTSSKIIKKHVSSFEKYSKDYIHWNSIIEKTSIQLYQSVIHSQKDALHLACAIYKECDYFMTCNNKLIQEIINKSDEIKSIIGSLKVISPIDFFRTHFGTILLNEIFEDYPCEISDIPRINPNKLKGRNYVDIQKEQFSNIDIIEFLAAVRKNWEWLISK